MRRWERRISRIWRCWKILEEDEVHRDVCVCVCVTIFLWRTHWFTPPHVMYWSAVTHHRPPEACVVSLSHYLSDPLYRPVHLHEDRKPAAGRQIKTQHLWKFHFFADVEKVVDASWSTELRHNRFQFEPEGCWRVNPSSSACTLQESSLEVKRVNTIIDMYRSRQQPDGNAVVFVDTDD